MIEVNGSLAGFMAAFRGKQNRKRHSVYLVLGVDEDCRGKGIASVLFEEIFEWSRSQEVTRLELTVIKDNLPAFNLYRKMGFVLEGEKVNSLVTDDSRSMSTICMYKLL